MSSNYESSTLPAMPTSHVTEQRQPPTLKHGAPSPQQHPQSAQCRRPVPTNYAPYSYVSVHHTQGSQAHPAAQRVFDRRQRVLNLFWTAIGVSIAVIAVVFAIIAHRDAQTANKIAANSLLWTQKWELYKYCLDLESQRSQLDLPSYVLTNIFDGNITTANSSIPLDTTPPLDPLSSFEASYEQDYVMCQINNITNGLRSTFLQPMMLDMSMDPLLTNLRDIRNSLGASTYWILIFPLVPAVMVLVAIGMYFYEKAREDEWDIAVRQSNKRPMREKLGL